VDGFSFCLPIFIFSCGFGGMRSMRSAIRKVASSKSGFFVAMSNAYSPKPSLDDARARIDRAKQHIASLKHEITAVLPPDRTIVSAVAGPAFVSGSVQYITSPPILAILIGETVYNLRSALDYLVYELVYLDTGRPKHGTKFLIEDTTQKWNSHVPTAQTPPEKRRKMWLHGLTAAHQAALKRLQPCFGCKWTKTLRDISNPDKHRHLTLVEAAVHSSGHGAIGAVGPVMVTTQLTTKVAFDDGTLVTETLNELQEEVTRVIEAFDPDFK
jgi:hypothetical protein